MIVLHEHNVRDRYELWIDGKLVEPSPAPARSQLPSPVGEPYDPLVQRWERGERVDQWSNDIRDYAHCDIDGKRIAKSGGGFYPRKPSISWMSSAWTPPHDPSPATRENGRMIRHWNGRYYQWLLPAETWEDGKLIHGIRDTSIMKAVGIGTPAIPRTANDYSTWLHCGPEIKPKRWKSPRYDANENQLDESRSPFAPPACAWHPRARFAQPGEESVRMLFGAAGGKKEWIVLSHHFINDKMSHWLKKIPGVQIPFRVMGMYCGNGLNPWERDCACGGGHSPYGGGCGFPPRVHCNISKESIAIPSGAWLKYHIIPNERRFPWCVSYNSQLGAERQKTHEIIDTTPPDKRFRWCVTYRKSVSRRYDAKHILFHPPPDRFGPDHDEHIREAHPKADGFSIMGSSGWGKTPANWTDELTALLTAYWDISGVPVVFNPAGPSGPHDSGCYHWAFPNITGVAMSAFVRPETWIEGEGGEIMRSLDAVFDDIEWAIREDGGRQLEVFKLLRQGKGSTIIANTLGVSERTVRRDIQDIEAKAKSRVKESKMRQITAAEYDALKMFIARVSPAYLEGAEKAGLTPDEIALDWEDMEDTTWTSPNQLEAKLGLPPSPPIKHSAEYEAALRKLNSEKNAIRPAE